MIGKRLCEVLMKIFEDDRNSQEAKHIAEQIAAFVGVNKISVGLYEENKNMFRILITNYLEQYEKIPADLVTERESFARILINNNELYVYKLYNDSQNSLVGVIFTESVPEKMTNFRELADFLSYTLWFIPNYEKARIYLEKYRSLWLLTNIFESSESVDQLILDFLKVISDIVEAEYVCVLSFDGTMGNDRNNGMKVINVRLYDTNVNKFKNFSLTIDDPTFEKYFKSSDKILYRPQGMENLLGLEKVLSALLVFSELGWFIFVNKKEQKGYSTSKSFNSMEMEIARDSVNRLVLAVSRIHFDQRLSEELEKLKKLQSNYEQLIEEQKEQIRKMNAVHYVSQAIRSMYSVKNVYKALLLGLTSGRLLGYNRALLLTYDEKRDVLIGKMWLGPEGENVEEDWRKANLRAMRYSDVVQYLREESMILETDNSLTRSIEGKIFPYKGHPILQKCVVRRKIFISNDKIADTMGLDAADLINLLGTKEFAVIPLVGREETYGVVIVDNYYTKKSIKDNDVEILKILS
ncbi:MAG: GAF domain-containing protein, partial [Fervidobacterium sp.]